MKNVLIISFSALHHDPRVLRQIQALINTYRIFTIGDTPINDARITFYPTNEPKPAIKRTFFQKVIRRLKKYQYICKNYKRVFPRILAFKNNFIFILNHEIVTPDFIIANESRRFHEDIIFHIHPINLQIVNNRCRKRR